MSRWIEAEWLKELYKPYESYNGKEFAVPIGAILANIDDAPSIKTKEVKYFDEDEKVWKIGEVIIDGRSKKM